MLAVGGNESVTREFLRPEESSITTITSDGDLLLQIEDQARQRPFYYRVSSRILKHSSPYFDNLLDAGKFSEGAMFATRIAELQSTYDDFQSIPATDLPIIHISNTGLFSENTLHQAVLIHFFDILHNTTSVRIVAKGHAVNHIAVLAAIADRFSATPVIVKYAKTRKWSQLSQDLQPGKGNIIRRNNEILRRQKIYAGYVYGFNSWVLLHSRLLIESGSVKWTDSDPDVGEDYAPWWTLPGGLEGQN